MKKAIFYFFFFLFTANATFAQIGDQGNVDKSVYDEYREKLFEEYSYEQYLQDQQKQIIDSLEVEEKILISPEELKKLGVTPEIIAELQRLNEETDSIANIKLQFEEFKREEAGQIDSISLDDIEALIDFQKRMVVKKALSLPPSNIYGHEFFRKNSLKLFDQQVDMRAPENYQLGIGDELHIVIWGNADYDNTFQIDKSGSIDPQLVGRIYLRGLTFEAAKSLIKKRFATAYDLNNSKIDITLTYTRVVNVNLVGELFNPGTYQFPALNTVFNALVAIDGPNQLGSVRTIHIRRDGKTETFLDLYKLLTDPDSNQDFFLEDNDYVVVPALNKIVAITGEVRRPHSYELIENEGIVDLIKFAGGLGAKAYSKSISIKRIQESTEVLLNINLDSLLKHDINFELEDGDSVFVYKIPDVLRNYVEISGAVKVPGKYELKSGERVRDVLLKAQGLSQEAYGDRAYVQRLDKNLNKQLKIFNPKEIFSNPQSPQNFLLQDLDTIQIISKSSFRQEFTVSISGAVQEPGDFEYAEGMTLKDLLFYSGGLKKEAANNRIEVSRVLNFSDAQTTASLNENVENKSRIVIKSLEIGKNLDLLDGSEQFVLQPYDNIFVRTSPDFELQQNIKLYGEVKYPGEYSLLNKEETITEVIARAGGLTDYAFKEGATLFRVEDSVGYVILDLSKIGTNRRSTYDYILTDNDSIFIPKVKDFVSIKGAVNYPNIDSIGQINVPFEGNKSAKYYINKYGAGFSQDSKRKETYVTLANGEVLQTTNLFVTKVYPKVQKGSEIFVDLKDKRKPENNNNKKDERNWNDRFEQLTSGLLTVLTLLILGQQAIN